MRPLAAVVLALAIILAGFPVSPISAQESLLDLPLPGGGRWFTQASGEPGGRLGFAVVDDARAPFWREFQRLGGASQVGFPISRRFVFQGFETQMFQKLVFQWNPVDNRLDFVNIFDVLSDAGQDDALLVRRQVPPRARFNETGKDFPTITRERLALLDKNAAIKQAYNSVSGDPIAVNGLPTAEIADFGNVQVLRAQRVVYQFWKEAVPWAAAGSITVANGGDLAKESGIFPAEIFRGLTLVEATAPGGTASIPVTIGQPSAPGQPSGTPAPTGVVTGTAPSATPPVFGTVPVTPTTTPIVPILTPVPTIGPIASTTPGPSAPPSNPGAPLVFRDQEALLLDVRPESMTPKPGSTTRVNVRVTDAGGKPIPGALALIFVHYPLKSDDTIYAVDGIFFATIPTDSTGSVIIPIRIDPLVPSGLPISLEVSAIYPPTAGQVLLPMAVG